MSKKEQEIFLSRINFLDNFFNDLFNKKKQERRRKSRSLFYKESLSELQRMADEISPLSVSGDEKGAGIKKHKVTKRKQSKKKANKKKQSKKKANKKKATKKKQGKKKQSKKKQSKKK